MTDDHNRNLSHVELPKEIEIGHFARHYRAPFSIFAGFMFTGVIVYIGYNIWFTPMNTPLRLKGIGSFIAFAAFLPSIPMIYFSIVLDTLAGSPCLILTEEGFIDTRVSENMVRWCDVCKVELWNDGWFVRGVKVMLSNPCVYKVEYQQKFGRSCLLSRYMDPNIINISMWTLIYNKKDLIEKFRIIS